MKMFVNLLVLFISFNSIAEQCVIKDKDIDALSKKNRSLLLVEHWNVKPGGIVISIRLPKSIEGKKLSGISIERKCQKANCAEYLFNLSPSYDKDEYGFVMFSGNHSLFKDAELKISYGDRNECVPFMSYRVSNFISL